MMSVITSDILSREIGEERQTAREQEKTLWAATEERRSDAIVLIKLKVFAKCNMLHLCKRRNRRLLWTNFTTPICRIHFSSMRCAFFIFLIWSSFTTFVLYSFHSLSLLFRCSSHFISVYVCVSVASLLRFSQIFRRVFVANEVIFILLMYGISAYLNRC